MSKQETYFYQVGDSDGDDYVLVVSKSFWEENGHLDDCHLGDNIMPTGFYEMQESMFEYEGSMDAARQVLNAAGFVEKQLF
jgi:hypothetical protein